MITYNDAQKKFHIGNGIISYTISIQEELFAAHTYFGRYLTDGGDSTLPFPEWSTGPNPSQVKGRHFSLNTLPQEYPGHANGDYRESAFSIEYSDGSFASQFTYVDYEIIQGKPELDGLPQTRGGNENTETLIVTLHEERSNLFIELYYTIFETHPVMTRSTRLVNKGSEQVSINKLMSLSVDTLTSELELIQLPGSWARERSIVRHPLHRGVTKIDSKRGTTHHSYQPFLGLVSPQADEHSGDVYGFHFVYSGEFAAQVEVDEYDQTRIQMGINPEHFKWQLNSGEEFQTPEAVMVFSSEGLNGMSQALHSFYQSHLVRTDYQWKERPILINNWEATYFDFTEDKLLELAYEAKQLGIECVVLDDGWFGHRDDDTSSLGDWQVDSRKLPNGLGSLSEKIHEMGMLFGLWLEPEMISVDSELYNKHPDWVLKAKGRDPSRAREQLMLDYSKPEVRDYIVSTIDKLLNEVPVDYIKWDYNRNMTEHGTLSTDYMDGEVMHRNILGLYDVLDKLTTSYPSILWESCSGGGGRYDLGLLYYMPQTWASDNTDAVSRLSIQYGTSLVFPVSSMGAHVSDVPNHQVGRSTSLKMRHHVSMSGLLGYELDLSTLSAEEKSEVKKEIDWYKANRSLIQFGEFTRLLSPFNGKNEAAWTFTNKEKTQCIFFYFQILAEANDWFKTVKLKGLDENKRYVLEGTEQYYFGDELMYKGIVLDPMLKSDFSSRRLVFKAVK